MECAVAEELVIVGMEVAIMEKQELPAQQTVAQAGAQIHALV
jgi:hypothetical protein